MEEIQTPEIMKMKGTTDGGDTKPQLVEIQTTQWGRYRHYSWWGYRHHSAVDTDQKNGGDTNTGDDGVEENHRWWRYSHQSCYE
jgi:hypothetical protein